MVVATARRTTRNDSRAEFEFELKFKFEFEFEFEAKRPQRHRPRGQQQRGARVKKPNIAPKNARRSSFYSLNARRREHKRLARLSFVRMLYVRTSEQHSNEEAKQ